jgi:hypothetical protein
MVMDHLTSLTPAVWALSTFDPPRQFVVTKSCHATTSIRSGSAPVVVQPGHVFKALGSNKEKPEATHVQIEVQGQYNPENVRVLAPDKLHRRWREWPFVALQVIIFDNLIVTHSSENAICRMSNFLELRRRRWQRGPYCRAWFDTRRCGCSSNGAG